ncbi:MAG TPA: protein kinase [Gemmatimonadales bacterium]|nr:protein kinase [Gemmatimonadales bacterium]
MADPLADLWSALREQYQREREVARGGMATVFLARDLRHSRQVAIKVLPPELATAIGVERFQREINLAANLMHPHIVQLFDSGQEAGHFYYVMPFIDGGSLRSRLDHERQLPIVDAVRIAGEVAGALGYAHSRGVVHRDIKPENILFMASKAVVADFGVARELSASHLTPTGPMPGTPYYMSPEQASSDGSVLDGRSDLFSLGCVLYEMLAGEQPFTGPTVQAIVTRILTEEPRGLQAVRRSIPPSLEKVVFTALAKTPADRYPDMERFLAALRDPAGDGQVQAIGTSIAVLPFVNQSAEPDQEYFSDGITEAIIHALAQLKGLRVAARTSSFACRGLDVSEIGARLRVDTVLEGRVGKQGRRLRIHVRLTKCREGIVLWSEKYDREMTDIFVIEDEIAGTIASRLDVAFEGRGTGASLTPPTANLDAYHLYLKGRYHWTQRGRGLGEALEDFTRALKLDPHYAEAHAGLADTWTLLGIHGLLPPAEVMPQARDSVRRALELQPGLADAHAAAGTLKLVFEWDFLAAEVELRRAIDLDSRSVAARYWIAICLGVTQGRTAEALIHAHRAIELDPLAALPRVHHAMVLMAADRHGEAVAPLERAIELAPTLYIPHLYLGVALNALQRPGEAVERLEAAAAYSGRSPIALASLAAAFGYLGRLADAEAIHDELRARARREYVQTGVLSITSAVLGRLDEAFVLLNRACDERDGIMIYSRAYPAFRTLQGDPRMLEIYRKIGFPGH